MSKQRLSNQGFLAVLVSLFLVSQTAVAETLDGRISFQSVIEINSIVRGTVAQVNSSVGDRVKSGEILIELDSTRQKAMVRIVRNQVAKMQIEVDDADAKFTRQQDMYDRGSLSLLLYEESENALKKAQLDLAIAQANLTLAEHELSLTQLTAPFDALVVNSNVHPGLNVDPELSQAPLMTLASAGQYIVQVSVSPEIWQRLNTSQSIDAVVAGQIYAGSVQIPTLFPQVFVDEPEYIVNLRFTENDKLLLPGTSAVVNFE